MFGSGRRFSRAPHFSQLGFSAICPAQPVHYHAAAMPTREEILATEAKVLQAMCAGTPEGTVWDQGMLLLAASPSRASTHHLIFETPQEINTDPPPVIRQQLPPRLTRKGFPAVD